MASSTGWCRLHPHIALAESVMGPYKTELVYRHRPWRSVDDLELATLEWIDWYNHRRLHGACRLRPPTEFDAITDVLGSRFGRPTFDPKTRATPESLPPLEGEADRAVPFYDRQSVQQEQPL